MKTRELGKSGRRVSALGLGCLGLGFSYSWPKDQPETTALRAPPWNAASLRLVYCDSVAHEKSIASQAAVTPSSDRTSRAISAARVA